MLQAEFLSGFRLTDTAGREVTLTVRKARALFAYLVLNSNRLHSRERLATLLWDAAGDHYARQSLRKCLSDLHRSLSSMSAETLVFRGDRVGIAPGTVDLDVLSFRRLIENGEIEKAADLLGNGTLLDGLDINSEPFQEWLAAERARHYELAVEAFVVSAARIAQQSEWQAVIRLTRTVLAIDPICEDAHRLLIRALNETGKTDAARRQYLRCAEVLRDELGVLPAAATKTAAGLPEKDPSPGAATKPVVVVRTFRCLGDGDLQEDLATGFSDDLVFELSRYRWFSVVRDGGAGRYVVDGSVRFSGGVCRVGVRLEAGADSAILWSEKIDGTAGDLLVVQGEIARAAAARVVAVIEWDQHRRSMAYPGEETAAGFWHRGMQAYFRFSKDGNAAAKRLFGRAIDLDPGFAPAYASLAVSEQFDAFFQYSQFPEASLTRALELARTSIELDPVGGYAHMALGSVLTRMHDFDNALMELEVAQTLCPSMQAIRYSFGVALYYQGRQAEAFGQFERAVQLIPHGPRSWALRHMMARCCYDLGHFEDSLQLANQAVNAPHPKSIAFAMKAAAARRAGYERLSRLAVEDLVLRDPALTTNYILRTFSNDHVTDPVEDMVDNLRRAGLPD